MTGYIVISEGVVWQNQILCKDTSVLANLQQNSFFLLFLSQKRFLSRKRGKESFAF